MHKSALRSATQGCDRSWVVAILLVGLLVGVASLPQYGTGDGSASQRESDTVAPMLIPASDPSSTVLAEIPAIRWQLRVGRGPVSIEPTASNCVGTTCDGYTVPLDATAVQAVRRSLGLDRRSRPVTQSSHGEYSLGEVIQGFVELQHFEPGSAVPARRLELPSEGGSRLYRHDQYLIVGLTDFPRVDPCETLVLDRLALVDAATGTLICQFRVYPGCTSVGSLDDVLVLGTCNGFVVAIVPEELPGMPSA